MNKEQSAMANAAKQAKRDEFEEQTIVINDDWRIVRADELNWEIQCKGKFKGFYGNLRTAFEALPDKMLSKEARGSIAEVLRGHKAIQETIEAAVQRGRVT